MRVVVVGYQESRYQRCSVLVFQSKIDVNFFAPRTKE